MGYADLHDSFACLHHPASVSLTASPFTDLLHSSMWAVLELSASEDEKELARLYIFDGFSGHDMPCTYLKYVCFVLYDNSFHSCYSYSSLLRSHFCLLPAIFTNIMPL